MTRPHFWRFIGSATARQQSQGPLRFVSITASQSDSVSCSIGPRMLIPALLTRMSSRPNASSVLGDHRPDLAVLVTSAPMPTALLPKRSPLVPPRSVAVLFLAPKRPAPRRRDCLDHPRPSPPSPVTSATVRRAGTDPERSSQPPSSVFAPATTLADRRKGIAYPNGPAPQ